MDKGDFLKFFSDVAEKTHSTVSRIEITPVHMHGDTYLCGIKKVKANFFMHLKNCQKSKVIKNGIQEIIEEGEGIWITPECLSEECVSRCFYDFKHSLGQSKELFSLLVQFREQGNLALQEEYIIYSTRKKATKEAIENRKRENVVKVKVEKVFGKGATTSSMDILLQPNKANNES